MAKRVAEQKKEKRGNGSTKGRIREALARLPFRHGPSPVRWDLNPHALLGTTTQMYSNPGSRFILEYPRQESNLVSGLRGTVCRPTHPGDNHLQTDQRGMNQTSVILNRNVVRIGSWPEETPVGVEPTSNRFAGGSLAVWLQRHSVPARSRTWSPTFGELDAAVTSQGQ
jgi:hypothetical protein